MNDDSEKTIINVYRERFGYSDFVRGTMYLSSLMHGFCTLEWSVEKSIRSLLKFPGPDLSTVPCINTQTIVRNRSRDERIRYLENRLNSGNLLAVCCNHPAERGKPFSPRIKEMFTLRDNYETAFEAFCRDLVGKYPFNVIHCRLGDSFMRTGNGRTSLYEKFTGDVGRLASGTTVLLTDDGEFREYIIRKFPQLIVTTSRPVHTSASNDATSVLSTFFEFRLMTKTRQIDCLSALPWGASGFSGIPAKVFQIPYTRKQIA